MSLPTYTRYPRAILWLVRGSEFIARPSGAEFETEVGSFYISKHVITNEQYEAFRPQHVRLPTALADDAPAVGVTFDDAQAYCAWYSEISKKQFRLPTEMEWEYACAGGSRARYPWGKTAQGFEAYAWMLENAQDRCQPVGLLEANEPGLHDMLGNVWEWTASMDMPFPVRENDGREAPNTTAPRVIRGGGFRESVYDSSSGVRDVEAPGCARDDLGFRIVRSL